MGRPALTAEQVRAKVAAYCEKYEVSPGPEGLPPFPSGKRETRQHREWLTVYRAHQRLRKRSQSEGASSSVPAGGSCPICSRALPSETAVPYAPHAARPVSLHPACAELARLADAVGPEAVARLRRLLWLVRSSAASRPRPPRG
jgi:hypothetical protein